MAREPAAALVPGSRDQAIRQRYTDIHELFARGVNITVISQRLQLDRKTVRRYVQADAVEHLLASVAKRGSALDEHTAYLRQRWAEGCTNALRLLEELRERGYTGSHRSVRRLVQSWRTATPLSAASTPAAPTPRDVAGWMMRPATALSDDEKRQLQQILADCDTLRQVNQLVADFAGMVRERGGKHLDTWIAAAKSSGIKQLAGFADGLLKDYDAVRNGLMLEWSSGAVEGNVNRVILWNLKCQVSAGQPWLTATIGSWVAVSDESPWRDAGRAGVGMSASRCSSRSRAA
ncbi:transposase [Nocardia sp. GAS34]